MKQDKFTCCVNKEVISNQNLNITSVSRHKIGAIENSAGCAMIGKHARVW